MTQSGHWALRTLEGASPKRISARERCLIHILAPKPVTTITFALGAFSRDITEQNCKVSVRDPAKARISPGTACLRPPNRRASTQTPCRLSVLLGTRD